MLSWAKRALLRRCALAAAALIVAAQLVALAHVHRHDPSRTVRAQTQIVADDGLCALCILAFHMPLNPAAAPLLRQPQSEARFADAAIAGPRRSAPLTSWRTRAPPRTSA